MEVVVEKVKVESKEQFSIEETTELVWESPVLNPIPESMGDGIACCNGPSAGQCWNGSRATQGCNTGGTL